MLAIELRTCHREFVDSERAVARWRGVRRRSRAAIDALRGRSAVAPVPAPTPTRPEGWWDLLPFTAHRISLAPGFETKADGLPPGDDVRTRLVVDACGGSLEGRTVVDLGCLEGGFTLAFAERGAARALGIEARALSVERCELARTLLDIDNAEFVVADIKEELPRHDPFDVVFATGILYHLADPADFVRAMRSACRHVALVDTHVADRAAPTHGCSPMVTRESHGATYAGRMFPEYPADATDEEKEALFWAAYSDVDAFWPTEDDLVKMLHAAGFSHIEKIDPVDDGKVEEWAVDPVNRVMYLAFV